MEMSKETMQGRMPVEVIEVPAALMTQMFFDVHTLAEMHQKLIDMYEKESALKKHHKPYLYVREAADAMCSQDKKQMAVIVDHYENPGRYMEQALCFHNHLMHPKRMADERKGQENVPEETSGEMDAFSVPKGMVMMSTGTLGTMQDDMLALTTMIEQLIEAFRGIEAEGRFDRKKMDALVGEAADLSSDVFNRWDDADMAVVG